MFAAHMYVYTHKYVCTVPSRRKKKLPQHEILSHETKLLVKMTLEGKGKRNRNRIEMAELRIATNACFLSISHSLCLSPSLDSSHPEKKNNANFVLLYVISLERRGYQRKNGSSNSEGSYSTAIAVELLSHKKLSLHCFSTIFLYVC